MNVARQLRATKACDDACYTKLKDARANVIKREDELTERVASEQEMITEGNGGVSLGEDWFKTPGIEDAYWGKQICAIIEGFEVRRRSIRRLEDTIIEEEARIDWYKRLEE